MTSEKNDARPGVRPLAQWSSGATIALQVLILVAALACLLGAAVLISRSALKLAAMPTPTFQARKDTAEDRGFDTRRGADGEPIVAPTSPEGSRAVLPITPTRRPGAVITNPSWRVRPGGEFPHAAALANVSQGAAILRCRVTPSGRIEACVTVSETPRGYGFAAAALEGARRAEMTVGTVDGAPVGGQVQYTTRFRLED